MHCLQNQYFNVPVKEDSNNSSSFLNELLEDI